MFDFVWTITLDTFGIMYITYKSNVSSFPVVLILKNVGIHICTTNSCNVTSNVEAFVNEILSFGTTLRIPNVNPDNSYVRFRRDFDNLRM